MDVHDVLLTEKIWTSSFLLDIQALWQKSPMVQGKGNTNTPLKHHAKR